MDILANQFYRLAENIDNGQLTLIDEKGKMRHFNGRNAGIHAEARINDSSFWLDITLYGDRGFANAYRLGKIETPDLGNLLGFIFANQEYFAHLIKGNSLITRIQSFLHYFKRNNLTGSKNNIAFHYDLSNQFYQQWLDTSMSYSSALYNNQDITLNQAQMQKYDKIIRQFATKSGEILEIGCGWGAMLNRCNESGDFKQTGLTLSQKQYEYIMQNPIAQSEILIQDYRRTNGKFDYIVSIEMFEAVGMDNWKIYFDKVKSLLKNKGQAFIQTITIDQNLFATYNKSSDFIRQYIFPGGMLPSDNLFRAFCANSGLRIIDHFEFGQDYAKTLRNWCQNFDYATINIANMGFDVGFQNMWRLYLLGCAVGFETGRIQVRQYSITH